MKPESLLNPQYSLLTGANSIVGEGPVVQVPKPSCRASFVAQGLCFLFLLGLLRFAAQEACG